LVFIIVLLGAPVLTKTIKNNLLIEIKLKLNKIISNYQVIRKLPEIK